VSRALIQSEWDQEKRPKETRIRDQDYTSFIGQYQRRDATNTSSASGIGIRREGDRIIAQALGSRMWPMQAVLPGIEGELLAESETRLFARMSGISMAFTRNPAGKVSGLTVQWGGDQFSFEKTSDQPPQKIEPPKPPVAIKLEAKLLDACAGHYEFPAHKMRLTIRRQGDRLVSQAWIEDDTDGPVELLPEAETRFFDKFGNRWTFVQNEKHEVQSLLLHGAHFPGWEGKKISSEPGSLLRDVKP
jgi:hypothetical protein